ncbi:MAG: cyclophilin-like fold protein [Bryobacterales bacterium]|nr:cyclophilin-like fold protein [Bryobacteraceae bacterium]MDW8355030.1 cyclophilin-like fold protein [Bryobacterales bacterium]
MKRRGRQHPMRVNFHVGPICLESEWRDTETSRRLYAALPIESSGSYWGGEFYFPVPIEAPQEADAREVVEPGTVAYWPAGRCLCLFWGPTPASEGEECRAASAVNVVGRILNPEQLAQLKGRKVRVEKAG